MENAVYRQNTLFKNMTDEEFSEAMTGLKTVQKKYEKGSSILLAGNDHISMGLVLSGSVTIESNDIWGNRTILSIVQSGHFFGETYAFLETEPMLVDVIANEDCEILFLNLSVIKGPSVAEKQWKIKLLGNLLAISARKNLALSGRSFHTAPKTIRGRVMAYLNTVSLKNNSKKFDIPFDRQQMADYLNLERSALSKELGKMQRDGLITVRKNHFSIL
ncbi:Crp/Fnr family transcriptional regulator [Lachnospiraceae bacterium C1.1]|nr:Crp/Fnr family transcriptional regulator [Lachnospiraceae bacterium C1.1]